MVELSEVRTHDLALEIGIFEVARRRQAIRLPHSIPLTEPL